MSTPPTPPPLNTGIDPPPAPPAPRAPGSGYIRCDFCECELTKGGEVYKMSETARTYRDEKEKHVKASAKQDEEIANLRSQLAAKDAEIAALKGSSGGRSPGIVIR